MYLYQVTIRQRNGKVLQNHEVYSDEMLKLVSIWADKGFLVNIKNLSVKGN